MNLSSAQRPMSAAALSLLAVGACAALPFLVDLTLHPAALIVAIGVTGTAAFVLHLIFIGIAARRLGIAVWKAVLGALLTFPIGSIVAVVLYEWSASDRADAAAGKAT